VKLDVKNKNPYKIRENNILGRNKGKYFKTLLNPVNPYKIRKSHLVISTQKRDFYLKLDVEWM
jgi:hypothetical protein